MKVKALKPFLDLKEGVNRASGEVFEATEARFKEINSKGFGDLVEKVPAAKPAAKRTTSRATKKEQ